MTPINGGISPLSAFPLRSRYLRLSRFTNPDGMEPCSPRFGREIISTSPLESHATPVHPSQISIDTMALSVLCSLAQKFHPSSPSSRILVLSAKKQSEELISSPRTNTGISNTTLSPNTYISHTRATKHTNRNRISPQSLV